LYYVSGFFMQKVAIMATFIHFLICYSGHIFIYVIISRYSHIYSPIYILISNLMITINSY